MLAIFVISFSFRSRSLKINYYFASIKLILTTKIWAVPGGVRSSLSEEGRTWIRDRSIEHHYQLSVWVKLD
jgi:hypothetical protein